VPHLTTFYLYVALGGAIGGVFVNLVAPVLFTGFWELHIALVGTVILAGVCIGVDNTVLGTRDRLVAFSSLWSIAIVIFIGLLITQVREGRTESIYVDRSFFGVLYVDEWDADTTGHERQLYHGRIQHGRQLMRPLGKEIATSYYGRDTGVAAALLQHPHRSASDPAQRGLKIGAIGLGIGTVSTYGTDTDSIHYYEIDPHVERVARDYFYFLENGKAATKVVLGDARISMQRELASTGSNEFDVLILDAFSGDAIPAHLLTEEAFDLYEEHMRNDGILAIHITNSYLDLGPLVRTAADRLGKDAIWVEGPAERWYEDGNDWVLISRNQAFFDSDRVRSIQSTWDDPEPDPVRWTDDFSNLLELIDWND